MTIEDDKLRNDLRTLLQFPQIALPDYTTDSVVQCRLGKVLADSAARVRIRPVGDARY